MSEVMIQVENLRKRYGDFEALTGISFKVRRGEVVGFLGPNGAGKTTTMKILTGYLAATEGSITVNGLDAFEKGLEVRNLIGYLPESNPLYLEMIVVDYLAYVAEMRGLPKDKAAARIKEVGTRCGLTEHAGKEIGELSKGLRQRVGLAQALLHDPPVLILDEPTSGLDPNQIVEIRQLIRDLGKDHTVILSTHNLPEVMQVCTRLLIVHKGRLVADGTAEDLQEEQRRDAAIILELAREGTDADAVGERIKGDLPVRDLARTDLDSAIRFTIHPQGGADLRADLFKLAAESGWGVRELHRDVLDLEGIFRRLTRD